MKYITSLTLGALFGVILTKAEVLSWFRIQEMFWFQGFHMYGVIGSAVAVGAISIYLLKRFEVKSLTGDKISPQGKAANFKGNFLGGTVFGLGWALTGACPGPLYALIGNGYGVLIIAVLSAMVGVFTYAQLRDKLPH